MNYQTALDTAAAKQARDTLEARFNLGDDARKRLEDKVRNMVIKDRMIHPQTVAVHVVNRKLHVTTGGTADDPQTVPVHSHAIGQMCDRANPRIPRAYFRNLLEGHEEWMWDLAKRTMNSIYQNGTYLSRGQKQSKFIGRFVVGADGTEELRGFVSQYFARHRASLPMMRGFLHSCERVTARPVSARITDLGFSMKSLLPYVFEPVVGEFIAFGVEWSNSDFADGALKVALCTQHIRRGTSPVIETAWSKTHLGSIVKESDIVLGQEAQIAEVNALVAAMSDSVTQVLSPHSVNRMLAAIEEAARQQLPWTSIKREIGRLLRDKELDMLEEVLKGTVEMEDLPPVGVDSDGNPLPTRWWASEAVGVLAGKEIDPARQAELEQLAGTLLKLS